MTRRIEKSIVVNVPLETAYHQWTNYGDFPKFMEGVKEVRQTDQHHLHWVAEVGNKTKEWDAEVVTESPNEVVSWRSTSGAPNHGTVRFRPVSPHESEVNLVVEYEPEGATENLASWFGVVSARVEGDLKRFKEFIESRVQETGTTGTGATTRPGQPGSTVTPRTEQIPGTATAPGTHGRSAGPATQPTPSGSRREMERESAPGARAGTTSRAAEPSTARTPGGVESRTPSETSAGTTRVGQVPGNGGARRKDDLYGGMGGTRERGNLGAYGEEEKRRRQREERGERSVR